MKKETITYYFLNSSDPAYKRDEILYRKKILVTPCEDLAYRRSHGESLIQTLSRLYGKINVEKFRKNYLH